MNSWQQSQQIKFLALAEEWPDTIALLQPDSVHISLYDTVGILKWNTTPGLAIRLLQDAPLGNKGIRQGVLQLDWELTLFVSVGGDTSGESEIIGKDRGGTGGGARGRGLLEFETIIMAKFETLTKKDGLKLQFIGSNKARISQNQRQVHTERSLFFKSIGTRKRTYEEPSRLRSTGSAPIVLTWDLHPDRFDRLKVRLFRNTSKITSIGQGGNVEITLSGDLATTVSDSPGTGTFFYGLFGIYVEPGDTTEFASEPENLRIVNP